MKTKIYRIVAAALAALFLSAQVMATSHDGFRDRRGDLQEPVVYEYVL